MDLDPLIITKNYTEALSIQCDSIENQIINMGVDTKFSRLLSIQAVYNCFKQLVGELDDKESQIQILKVIEFDSKNIVFNDSSNVSYTGHA